MTETENKSQYEMGKRRRIVERLFPDIEITPEDVEAKYPSRDLKKTAKVTRVAPSPTGFMHIGGVFAGLLSERLAHQSDGIFYVRIEDTDKKREVEGAAKLIVESFEMFDIPVDEGETLSGEEKGNYGPYRQSGREDIYKTFVKKLTEDGLAYPCFCTTEELEQMNSEQKENKIRTGYYGRWAKWRDKSDEEILQELEKGKPFVIRFRSNGNHENRIQFDDSIKGQLLLPENDQDIIIMKSDGLPTYHFAHVIDDHFMRTTDVIRGEEWLSSVPLHIELFKSLDWEPPRYGHFSPIQKLEGSSRRKLSKRKDPETNIIFYSKEGYPANAVSEYLLNLIDSDFEDWRKSHPEVDRRKFPINLEHLGRSTGPLLDFQKLQDISRDYIGQLSAEEVLEQCIKWARKYDNNLSQLLENDPEYAKKIFSIERTGPKPGKNIAKWSNVWDQIGYFFDKTFEPLGIDSNNLLPEINKVEIKKIVELFLSEYNQDDDQSEWFNKLKKIAIELGYSDNVKEYKKQKDKYKGHVGDVAMVLRVLLTGRRQTPDLFQTMQCMGVDRVKKRLQYV